MLKRVALEEKKLSPNRLETLVGSQNWCYTNALHIFDNSVCYRRKCGNGKACRTSRFFFSVSGVNTRTCGSSCSFFRSSQYFDTHGCACSKNKPFFLTPFLPSLISFWRSWQFIRYPSCDRVHPWEALQWHIFRLGHLELQQMFLLLQFKAYSGASRIQKHLCML